jgi:putative ubiquitin-RnfH superfamily antitoxin RatB of RatAB toxin-antitoxin module
MIDESTMLSVDVIFVTDTEEYSEKVLIRPESTVGDVIDFSKVATQAVSLMGQESLSFAIWGRKARLTDSVSNCDRIEILRPLIADPKELRRSGRLIKRRRTSEN